jgi:hypothetical protein
MDSFCSGAGLHDVESSCNPPHPVFPLRGKVNFLLKHLFVNFEIFCAKPS